MRALSIQQPWAWLIAHGFKDVENRNWPTRERGRRLIHAGKKFDRDGYDWVRTFAPQIAMPQPSEFELGGLVGVATLTDCVRENDSRWFFGEYGHVFRDAKPLPFTPLRGHLGYFDVHPVPMPALKEL